MNDPAAFVHDTLDTIWNQKMVGAVYETFFSGVRVHRSCREELYGRDALIVEIIEQLAAFPDVHLGIENIIWHGDERGYRVSIRLNFTGHNAGVSRYGAATNAEMHHDWLMNALIADGRFVEVWIADDERSLVDQLGFEWLDAVQSLEGMDAFLGKPVTFDAPTAVGEIPHEDFARLTVEKLAALRLTDESAVREVLSALWNGRQIGLCARFYSPDFTCHQASNRQLEGREDYQAFALAQLAAFPDLSFYVDDFIEQRRDDGWHVALNWTMLGTHAGPGIYGQPSGRRVQISGISQYVIQDQQFISERTEWNEFRLMQKIMQRPEADSHEESVT